MFLPSFAIASGIAHGAAAVNGQMQLVRPTVRLMYGFYHVRVRCATQRFFFAFFGRAARSGVASSSSFPFAFVSRVYNFLRPPRGLLLLRPSRSPSSFLAR